jgi:ATP-dependent DNA helicase RecQ
VKLLQQLHKEGIVEFEHHQHDTKITFLMPREDDITINPLTPYIKLQEKTKKEKIAQVLAYVTNDRQCKSQQLLHYFGEKETEPCGICSVCEPSTTKLTREEMKKIYFAIIGLLEEREHSSREMTQKLPFPEDHIIKVLEILVEKGALAKTTTNKYKLKHL